MSLPRGIGERRDWFLTHNPSGSGMCAQHVWHSLGGDQGKPPAWGTANANAVYDKVIAAGRYWTSTPIPKGAAIYWKYTGNGHAALSDGDGKIVTTDPSGSAMTGVEPLSYPEGAFGASASKRIWTDQYNGVRFDIGDEVSHGDVFLSKLHKGQQDSDSVKRLQLHLNDHVLADGSTLPVTGNFGDQTMHEIALDREQHGFPDTSEQVSEAQCKHLIPFGECGCILHADLETSPPPNPTEPPVETIETDVGIWDWYSGKRDTEKLVHPDGKWHDIDLPAQPASGKTGKSKEEHFLYLRVHLPSGRSATRTVHTRFVRSDGDETAYLSLSYDASPGNNSVGYPNLHIEKGSGLGGRWQIMVEGGTDPIDYTTRYAKTYVTYREG